MSKKHGIIMVILCKENIIVISTHPLHEIKLLLGSFEEFGSKTR